MTEWITGGVLSVTALGAVWFDVREHRIPNVMTMVALVAALALRALVGLPELGAGLMGGALSLLFALPFFLAGGLGGGDVKLMTAFGAMLGPQRLHSAFIIMALIGGVLAFATMIRRKVVARTFHNLGFMIRNFRRSTVASGWRKRNSGKWMTLDTPGAVTIPYGVAISVGALYAWFL